MVTIRTRFAPSPTGRLHLGNARTALFNWLFARNNGGSFVLRIEDTDTARSRLEYELSICEDLKWLGIEWDEGPDRGGKWGPYRQSERIEAYRREAERLVAEGKAYRCYCSKERLEELKITQAALNQPSRYDGRCRDLPPDKAPANAPYAIRFRVPAKEIVFDDGVHGLLKFDSRTIGDFVILGSDGVAAYNFAVVTDDAGMEISHVIRGDDHISNTPRQVLLFEALGLRPPQFTHIPLVLGSDKAPLSKRHGDFSLAELREEGYLPEGVVNALARLGWNPGEGLLTLDELSNIFSLERISKSPSEFDIEKLRFYNKEALQASNSERLIEQSGLPVDAEGLADIIEAVKGNASTLRELRVLAEPFINEPTIGPKEAKELDGPGAKKVISAFIEALADIVVVIDQDTYKRVIDKVKASTGEKGKRLFMPLRLALTGSHDGIELVNVLKILGKDEAVRRLKKFE